MRNGYNEAQLKRLTAVTRTTFVILGIMSLLLSIVQPVFLIVSVASFVFAVKYKAKNVGKIAVPIVEAAETFKAAETPIKKKKTISPPGHIDGCSIAYEFQNTDVAIMDKANIDYTKFEESDEVSFVSEPENKYDKKAIKVMYDDMLLGYIYKGKTQDMVHDWQKRKEPIFSAIQTVNPEGNKISLYIAFYRDPFKGIERFESLKTKLAKTSKKVDDFFDRQDGYSLLERGDELDLDYDDESETYVVSGYMGEIGEINKAISEKIRAREFVDDIICLVEEITEDDNEKSGAKVLIYFK